jgi:hypothetical protein
LRVVVASSASANKELAEATHLAEQLEAGLADGRFQPVELKQALGRKKTRNTPVAGS